MKLEEEIKSKFRNEYHKARLNIMFTHSILGEKIIPLFKNNNITAQQFNVLRILRGQHPQSINIKDIKERMLDKNSDVSRIIDRLFIKKLILRQESKTDRRQKDVKIAPTGLQLLQQMDGCEQAMDDLLANLSLNEVKQLNFLLDKIRD